jgi:hypothetical protein
LKAQNKYAKKKAAIETGYLCIALLKKFQFFQAKLIMQEVYYNK